MFVHPITAMDFKAGKIELDEIHRKDLTNYDSIKLLAKQNFCDFLIEKRSDFKTVPEYNLIKVMARRKWIQPNYVFGSEYRAVRKNASPTEVAKIIYETSIQAAKITKEKTLELAKAVIRK